MESIACLLIETGRLIAACFKHDLEYLSIEINSEESVFYIYLIRIEPKMGTSGFGLLFIL
jgi:hypothetical protein